MRYRLRADGRYPLFPDDIRRLSSFLFGGLPGPEILEEVEADIVEFVPPPAFDATTHFANELEPIKDGGVWKQAWELIEIPLPEIDPRESFVPVPLMRQRIERLGLWGDFSAFLAQAPELFLKITTLEDGLADPNDENILAAFSLLNVAKWAQDYILLPKGAGVPDPEPYIEETSEG